MSDAMEAPFVLPDLSEPSNQGSAWGPAPAGNYVLVVMDKKFVHSAVKGTPGLNLELWIDEGEYMGKRLWDDLWLTEKAFKRLSWFLRAGGSPLWNQNLAQVAPAKFLEALTEFRVGATLAIEEYWGVDNYKGSPTYGQQILKKKNAVEEYMPVATARRSEAAPAGLLVPAQGNTSKAAGGVVSKTPEPTVQAEEPDFSMFLSKGDGESNPDDPPLI